MTAKPWGRMDSQRCRYCAATAIAAAPSSSGIRDAPATVPGDFAERGQHMTKLWIVLGAMCLATAAQADEAGKPATKMKAPVTMTAADMKWTDMAAKGVQSATLWGDMNKGAFGALIKFTAGTTMPLHTHSSELKLVVISGTLFVGADAASAKDLGPGSYALQPAGWKHVTGCRVGADCIFFTEGSGKFDMKPVGGTAPATGK
jgi:quercetin dioxygenase-like cupin family protein